MSNLKFPGNARKRLEWLYKNEIHNKRLALQGTHSNMEDFLNSTFRKSARAEDLLHIEPCDLAKVDFFRKVNVASSFAKTRKIVSEALRAKSCSQEDYDLFKDGILLGCYVDPLVPNKEIAYYRKILITEKLHGIDPPPKGYELTVTFKRGLPYTTHIEDAEYYEFDCYDHDFKFCLTNLSTRKIFWEDMNAPVYWVDVYRGHLLVSTKSKLMRLRVVDDQIRWDAMNLDDYEYESDEKTDFLKSLHRFVIDKTTPVPTLLRISTPGLIRLARYGDVLKPNLGKYASIPECLSVKTRKQFDFILEPLFSVEHLRFAGTDLVQDFDDRIGFTSPVVDHYGNVWIRSENVLMICDQNLEVTEQFLLNRGANFNIFPTPEGDVLAVSEGAVAERNSGSAPRCTSEHSASRYYWHLSLEKYEIHDD